MKNQVLGPGYCCTSTAVITDIASVTTSRTTLEEHTASVERGDNYGCTHSRLQRHRRA
jgi:hypothetical protein